jgi:drug/metabolite transporter (DMT)-like permease
LILFGLVVINAPHLMENSSPSSYVLGLTCSFLALVAWSWYVVANARLLKQHPKLLPSDWSTLMGVATLFWVVFFGLFLYLFFEDFLHTEKYFTPSKELTSFIIGCVVLGLICSWVGAVLWNKASLRLPVSLAGQLTIFETVFGVLFFYILEQNIPPPLESVGIVVLLFAVVYGIRQFTREKAFY